jgi:putative pyruvate formate lyase activating enzyme
MGRVVDDDEFARICLVLQEKGAENINIVTGSHAAPALVRGIAAARDRGLIIPALWNSSAYESPEILARIRGTVDVYLPDLKTLDADTAERFFAAPDYPRFAGQAVLSMMEDRELRYNDEGTALASGVMIRHLVIPGFLESTRQVLRWFAENARGRALLSLMTQYTPAGAASPAPARCVGREEYHRVMRWLEEFGIEDGFCQELTAGPDRLPDFRLRNPFLPDLAAPVWHWREGFIRN